MSVTKRIAFGAAASWFSRAVTIVLALVLMPVLFHHLPKEELGIWLLLSQTSALLFILDFGLSVVLTRRIALAKGKSGSDPAIALNDETRVEIADLVESGRRLYQGLAVLTFVLSTLSGFFYLQQLHLTTLSLPVVWLAWGVLCLTQAFGVWAQVWNCLLSGIGYVGWDAVLGSFIMTITLLAQIAALFMGGGLITLATVAAVGLFAQRYLLLGFARGRRPELFAIRGNFNWPLVRGMMSPSLRAWATGLGSLVLLNTDQFFVAGLAGAAQYPAYRSAYLVVYNLNMLACTFAASSTVFVSHLWQARQIGEVHRVVLRNLRLGLGIMAAGGACILVLGPRLFDVWLGKGNFIGHPILAVFFALTFLEAQSYIITLGSRATEDEAFAFWALGSAALKLALAGLLGAHYGLIGIASSTLIAQLATNHWYMVYRGLKRLRIGLESHLNHVVIPVTGLFVLVAGAVRLTLIGGIFTTEWQAVLGCSFVAGCLLTAFMWLFVLEPGQRARFIAWRLPEPRVTTASFSAGAKPWRILISGGLAVGGPQTHVTLLCHVLREAGAKVTIASASSNWPASAIAEMEAIGVRVVVSPFGFGALRSLGKLWAVLVWPLVLRRDHDVLYCIGEGKMHLWAGRFVRTGACRIYHEIVECPKPGSVAAEVSAKMDAIIANSRAVGQKIARMLDGIPVRAIPFLTSSAPMDPPAPRELPRTLRIAFLGRLAPHKRPDLLIEAWPAWNARAPIGPARLDFYGGDFDNEGGRLRARIDELGLGDSVRLRGTYATSDLPKIFAEIDLVVLPSRYEGLPLVLVEAMQRGIPVVATSAGGTAELGEDNPDVIITEGTDWDKFAAGVETMAARIRSGEINRIRLHEWTESRYGFTPVAQAWREALLDSGHVFTRKPGSTNYAVT